MEIGHRSQREQKWGDSAANQVPVQSSRRVRLRGVSSTLAIYVSTKLQLAACECSDITKLWMAYLFRASNRWWGQWIKHCQFSRLVFNSPVSQYHTAMVEYMVYWVSFLLCCRSNCRGLIALFTCANMRCTLIIIYLNGWLWQPIVLHSSPQVTSEPIRRHTLLSLYYYVVSLVYRKT